jgi:dehydrogenase/reductase SDR family protein 4
VCFSKFELPSLVAAVQTFGRIDCLVSNAAVSPAAAPISETPGHAIDKILDINIKSAVLLVNVSAARQLECC